MRRGRPTKAEDAQLVYELEVQGQVVRHRNRALIGYLAGDKEYTLPGSNWRAVREIREECAWLIRPTDSAPPPAAESRAGEVHSDFRELMDAAWAINDKLRITPGMEAIFTGSTNDIDRFRDLLHDLEPAYRTAQEPTADSQITTSTGD